MRFAARAIEEGSGRLRKEVRLLGGVNGMVWVAASVAYLPGSNHGPDHFLAHLEYITERRQREEALRQSEVQYRTFVERLPVAMYRSRRDGQIVDGNQALADLLGYTDMLELRGMNTYEMYVDPGDRDNLGNAVDEAGFVVGYEYQLRRRDGSQAWVRDSTRLVGSGEGAHFEGALVDVTDRRRAQSQLAGRARQQEAVALLGRIALENPDIAVAIHRSADVITEILSVDATYVVECDSERRLGLAAAGGDAVASLPDAVLRLARDAVDGHGSPNRELASGGCSVVIPGPDAPYGAVVAIGRRERSFGLDDTTFMRAVGGVLGAAIERSRARSRLEKLVVSEDEFLAAISHEVRTPLTVVVGMADELRDGWQRFNDEEMEELIALLVDQSREMQDLLVAARADIGKVPVHMQEIDLAQEIRHVVTSLVATRRRGVVVPETDARAYADLVRFRQILRNLVTNALRHGGDQIAIEVDANGSTISVRVIDNGNGIPLNERERVFLPYESAHEAAGQPASVGLGLTIARKLAQLMRGNLTYDYLDRSVFELTLVNAVEIVPIR